MRQILRGLFLLVSLFGFEAGANKDLFSSENFMYEKVDRTLERHSKALWKLCRSGCETSGSDLWLVYSNALSEYVALKIKTGLIFKESFRLNQDEKLEIERSLGSLETAINWTFYSGAVLTVAGILGTSWFLKWALRTLIA